MCSEVKEHRVDVDGYLGKELWEVLEDKVDVDGYLGKELVGEGEHWEEDRQGKEFVEVKEHREEDDKVKVFWEELGDRGCLEEALSQPTPQ